MVVERDEVSGRVTLHVRGCKLMLSKQEADRLIRFLFVAVHRPQDETRRVSVGYDRNGQATLL